MNIYITETEMPAGCFQCPARRHIKPAAKGVTTIKNYCIYTGAQIDPGSTKGRPSNCPLKINTTKEPKFI